MRKIFFITKGKAAKGLPFWHPWGLAGCLGRLLLFLLMLLLLLFLLSLFHRCGGEAGGRGIDDPEYNRPPLERVPIDTVVHGDTLNITNPGEFLPDSTHNIVPPFNPDSVVVDTTTHSRVVGNVLNVILDSDAGDDTYRKWASEFKTNYPDEAYKILYYRPLVKLIQISVPSSRREAMLTELPEKISDIRFHVFIEEVFNTGAASRPNDPAVNDARFNWYFDAVQAYDAWGITQGDTSITVAVVDSYFDLNHDDLNSTRVVKPYSVLYGTGNVAPTPAYALADYGGFIHGSMVSSMAIGTQNNERGSSGIAPKCKFMPISIGNPTTSMNILHGLLYAIYQGANVVNISFGSAPAPELLETVQKMTPAEMAEFERKVGGYSFNVWDFVADLCTERNVTVVWAAGNEAVFTGFDSSKRSDKWIVVSGFNRELKLWEENSFLAGKSGSNFGNFPEVGLHECIISAPSVDVFGAAPFNRYDCGAGTSYAAPIVAGAVALMKTLDPSLKTEEIRQILMETGKPIPGASKIGPRLQIYDALKRVQARRS